MKKLFIILLLGLLAVSSTLALQIVYSETTNVTGSAWGAKYYTGFNKALCVEGYCEFNLQCYINASVTANGPKFYGDSSNTTHGNEDIYWEWDGTNHDYKEEPGFTELLSNRPAGLKNLTFRVNDTAGTYGVCDGSTCSSMDADYTFNNNYTFSIGWGEFGSIIWCDDFTVSTLTVADTTAPSILFVRNHTISNASAIIESNASEASNMSVKYGTTLNLGSQSGNTSVATNVSVGLSGLAKLTLYYYNVTRCDASANCNTSGPRNFTTTDNPAVNTTIWELNLTGITGIGNHSIETVWANITSGETYTNGTNLTFRVSGTSPISVSRCSAILSLVWPANISLGTFNPITNTYTESPIYLRNHTSCGWDYNINNTQLVNVSAVAFTNLSSSTMWLEVNGTKINTSQNFTWGVAASTDAFVNVTLVMNNTPLVVARQSISFNFTTVS